ncbi:hypothetical protein [Synechococcus sp. RS9916]|nr:hypothetical protein [Synechococcus sp. RS9916]
MASTSANALQRNSIGAFPLGDNIDAAQKCDVTSISSIAALASKQR